MNEKKLNTAIQEAERFLERARALKAEAQDFGSSPARAAVRRASLDLTRALAALRAREA